VGLQGAPPVKFGKSVVDEIRGRVDEPEPVVHAERDAHPLARRGHGLLEAKDERIEIADHIADPRAGVEQPAGVEQHP